MRKDVCGGGSGGGLFILGGLRRTRSSHGRRAAPSKDDKGRSTKLTAGKPGYGGPFKIRVRLGLKVEFDRFLDKGNRPPFHNMTYPPLCIGVAVGI